MKNGKHHIDQDPVKPRAYSSEYGLAEHDVNQRHHAAQRRVRIMPAIDGAAAASVVIVANNVESAMPKRTSLPSMLPPDCIGCMLIDSLKQRIAPSLRPVRSGHARHEQNRHSHPHRPAMALRSGHAAQRVGQPGGNHENGKHLQIVARRCGILERMGAVGVEKTAAVRAQHLNRFLRRDRPLRDHLVGHGIHHRLATLAHHRFPVRSHPLHLLWRDQFDRVIPSEVLHHTLRNQNHRVNDARRQQHPQGSARQVDPKIADGLFLRRAIPRMNAIANAMPTAAEAKL